MKLALNIARTYTLDKSFEEVFAKLQAIVETSSYDSKYSLLGNYFLTEPPEFIFMAKGITLGRPLSVETFSTKLSAKLYRLDGRTRITIETSTNPIFFVFLAVMGLSIMVQLIKYNNLTGFGVIAGYLLGMLIILGIDRFAKNLVVASFENELNMGTKA